MHLLKMILQATGKKGVPQGGGNMSTPRSGHTATLLPDGRVLIAGGQSNITYPLAVSHSAELYDPSSGTFAATGDMKNERLGRSAALLADGRVLIGGGDGIIDANFLISSAEIYDPVTASFTATGNTNTARFGASAALLPNGKVLIAGGHNGADGPILKIESYDPRTSAFSLAGEAGFPSSVGPDIMGVLPNGKVLINMITYDRATPDSELYDPASMTFVLTGSMTVQRSFTSTLLSTGTVLTAGDWSVDEYDPTTGVFTRAGDLITARTGYTVTLLADGTVLIAGGSSAINGSSYLNKAELFNPSMPMPSPVLYALSSAAQGTIWHATTGEVAISSNPAVAGQVLSMYTSNLIQGGVIPPQVAIGGRLDEVLYFGASGYPGYNQVNFRVPSGLAPGSARSVRLNYIDRSSNQVTLGVR